MPHLPTHLRDAALSGRELSVGSQLLPARVQRAVQQGVDIEQGCGMIQAALAQAVHYVVRTAAWAIEDLTHMEALAITRNQLCELRVKASVDTATAACADIVAETGRL